MGLDLSRWFEPTRILPTVFVEKYWRFHDGDLVPRTGAKALGESHQEPMPHLGCLVVMLPTS